MVLFTLSDSVVVESARNSWLLVVEEAAADDALDEIVVVERATAALSVFKPNIFISYFLQSITILFI